MLQEVIINAVIEIQFGNTVMRQAIQNIFQFYYQGFRQMTLGKKLWIIILLKLAILFLVFKIFFFPNYLKSNFKTDEQRSNHVIEQLTK
jgi:hypothetical protein